MPQTMLALLALVVAGTFVLNQQRHSIENRIEMIRSEIATQATSVAVDRLEEIGSYAFDEAIGLNGDKKLLTPLQLTPMMLVGGTWEFTNDTPLNDIDDFHLAQADTFRFSGPDTLHFRLESYISYALDSDVDAPVTVPTKVKQATVRVWSLDLQPDMNIAPDTIVLSQSFTCGSRCAW